MVFQNHGQRFLKSRAMFPKNMGNVFYFYGQRFFKRWAMFFALPSNINSLSFALIDQIDAPGSQGSGNQIFRGEGLP